MDSGGGSLAEVEMAWHLLTVLIRLGRPAAPSELAAAALAAAPSISTRVVEQMCCLPRSPLWISDDGVVRPSETAVLAFLRFMGWGIPGPKVSLRPSEVRRWSGKVSIRYERKRQGSDARCFNAKRRRLLAPDAGSLIS
jgi:cell division control protein 7